MALAVLFRRGDKTMTDYGKQLRTMGLTDTQIVTVLSGWTCDSIEALLRGEIKPPSHNSIVEAAIACGC